MQANMVEIIREYVVSLGFCDECIAKLPDPLSEGWQPVVRAQRAKSNTPASMR